MNRQFEDSRTLGKYTPAAPVQLEELKAQYERIAQLERLLRACREYFEKHADSVCDPDGAPLANDEMILMNEIDEAFQ